MNAYSYSKAITVLLVAHYFQVALTDPTTLNHQLLRRYFTENMKKSCTVHLSAVQRQHL